MGYRVRYRVEVDWLMAGASFGDGTGQAFAFLQNSAVVTPGGQALSSQTFTTADIANLAAAAQADFIAQMTANQTAIQNFATPWLQAGAAPPGGNA